MSVGGVSDRPIFVSCPCSEATLEGIALQGLRGGGPGGGGLAGCP